MGGGLAIDTPFRDRRIPARRQGLYLALFVFFLGLPLGALVYLVLAWIAVSAGAPLRVVQASGYVIVPVAAWFIARAAYRGTAGYRAREGHIVEDPGRRLGLAALAACLIVLAVVIGVTLALSNIPLVTWVVLNAVVSLVILYVIASIVGRLERRGIRAIRRESGLCQRCGYSLDGVQTPTCPECGHDNSWRFDGRPAAPNR